MPERGPDRRQQERRQADRRRTTETRPPVSPSTAFRDAPSTLTAALGGDPELTDGSLLAREAHRVARAPGGAVERIVRTYAAARAAVGLALVGAQVAISGLGAATAPTVVTVCVLYAVQAALLWLLPSLRPLAEASASRLRPRAWWVTIGTDLFAFGLLHVLDAGASFNYAALLVLPVLMSGVLMTRLVALGTAAAVALLLLGVTLRAVGGSAEGAVVLAQSGLAGMGLFVIVLLAGEMASRMARDELAARGSLAIARQQAQLNRLVIEEMADGVLVVDRRLRVRAANPAARQLLVATGLAPLAPFSLAQWPALAPLCRAIEQAMTEERWPDTGRPVQLDFGPALKRTLRLRVRFTRSALLDEPGGEDTLSGQPESLCVVLFEDDRIVQARLRQEKLAAMGRVSAGIAHEFRNPLAAISQANALLLEEPLDPAQQQLTRMVADNVRRLQRIVDDVLELAPNQQDDSPVVEARVWVEQVVSDWANTSGVTAARHDARERASARVWLDMTDAALRVQFDPEHLRRVLVNLLDNALRHGTSEPGAIALRLAQRDEQRVVLSLASDGPPIDPEVEPHLFEPFFSTRSRGSGLGLYICRELCERYGASIEFRARSPQDRHRNGFVVTLRRADHPAGRAASDPSTLP
jgi:two-component system sensor histidine kinase PilS (NtrC family)